jgi:acetylornithine deacetylase/succinyl-diaminopimelate desuccinylase-like protein
MPDTTEALKDELSVHTPEGGGERLETLIAEPAVNVRGIEAGGVGGKGRNIIVSSATASLDLRLVPDQVPERVRERLEAHVAGEGFHVVHDEPSPDVLRAHEKVARLQWDSGYPALRTPLDDPMAERLTRLMRRIAPDLIVTPSMGGSLPLYEFGNRLSAPIVILPLANHDNNQHAENENIRLQNLWDAMRIYAAVLAAFGAR